jgi:hypothetical protein
MSTNTSAFLTVVIVCSGMMACVPFATEKNVNSMPMGELCTSVIVARNLGNAKAAVLALDEIEARGQFTDSQMSNIRTNTIVPGMSEDAALCAWGNGYASVNVTATAGGTSKQYVYSSDYSKTRYFYTENGKVTAIQM